MARPLSRVLVVCCVLAGTMPAAAAAAQIHFDAAVDRIRVAAADPIRLTLTISSDESLSHVPAPEIDLKDFDAYGPTVSTMTQIINFHTTFTRQLTYTLYARRAGRMSIGPARLRMQGRSYETKAIEVEVALAAQPGGRGAKQGRGARVEDRAFVRATSDRRRAYVGQQVSLEYDLCYRVALRDVGFKEIPTFSGFWTKELFAAQQLQAHREVIEGLEFKVAPLRRMALFPTSAGIHKVDALVVSCSIPSPRSRRGGLFDDFFDDFAFGHSAQPILLRSREVEVEALPLPQENRPAAFDGAVGQFAMKAWVQPRELPAGDPVTLRVEIGGLGNLEAVKAPALREVEGFKIYEPKVKQEEKIEQGLYGGTRTFEYILIPEKSGELEIPPLHFAYFDPTAAQYRVLQSAAASIVSRGGAKPQNGNVYGLTRKEIVEVGQDIRYIKPDARELEEHTYVYRRGWFWILQATMPLAFLGLWVYQRHQQRLEGDLAYARRRRARGEAHRRLRQAAKLLEEGDGTAFHAEIQRAVLSFVADQLNLSAAGLSGERCAPLLEERGVGEEAIATLGAVLDQCDFARFASGKVRREDMEALQERARALIATLEKDI